MSYAGDPRDPMDWVIKWFAIVVAVAVTFVATPQLYGATYDWAVGYMAEHYGSWMVAIGGFFWWIIVAALTFLFSTLLSMLAIRLGNLAFAMIGRGSR